jgi:hypothetical protein
MPNLFLASKLICRKSVEVLYSKNSFRLERPGGLVRFEEQKTGSSRDLVRRIEVVSLPMLKRLLLLLSWNLDLAQ